jgi:hypothetical protein
MGCSILEQTFDMERGEDTLTIVTDARGCPVQLDELDADWLLALAEDADVSARVAQRTKLRLAAQWCVLHEVHDAGVAAQWSDAGGRMKDYDERIGSAGTPMIAEFAVEPLSAALRISPSAAMELLSDVLDLQHRLPRTHARVENLEVEGWRARRVARATRSLSAAAAGWVDAQVAPLADSCGVVRLERLVQEAAARFDAVAEAETELDQRRHFGVRLDHGLTGAWFGASTIEITGDTPTLTRLHDLIGELAHELLDPDRDGFRSEDLGLRQIAALGVMCDRAQGLPPNVAGRPHGAKTKLYVHCTLSDLLDPLIKVGDVERLGPLTLHAIRSWVDTTRCTISPVLDLARTDGVDSHDPPPWMAELVRLRDRECIFPRCGRTSRACDLDHITAYVAMDDGGPPGQTHPGNLAPLCRRHHRLKTSRRWRYARNPDGTYTWTTPQGRQYTVAPDGRVAAH